MSEEDFQPDRKSITAVNLLLTRVNADRLLVRLGWTQNGISHTISVLHRMGVSPAAAMTYARNTIIQVEHWHTTIDDAYACLAGEDRGLSVER